MSTDGQRDPRQTTEDDVRVQRTGKIPQLNFASNTLSASLKGNAAGMTDDDSGLPSSTKSGRRLSLSSDDTGDMEEKGCSMFLGRNQDGAFKPRDGRCEWEREERSGVPRLANDSMVKVSHTLNPEWDEAVMVEDGDESIESPRSDGSSAHEYELMQLEAEDQSRHTIIDMGLEDGDREMTTFSSKQNHYFDEEDDSGDENIHRRLYGRNPTPSSSWSCERPRASSTSSIRFTRSKDLLASEQTISSLRRVGASTTSVDDSVRFFPSAASTQSRYSPDCISALSPPFGNDENLLKKVGNSISSLMSSSSYNMSQRASAGEGSSAADGKKKKKKKKDGRDESAREGGGRGKSLMTTTDVNGNPIDAQLYRQMRKQPNESSAVVSGRGSASNHDYSGGRGDLQDMGNKSDDPISPTASSANGQSEKKKKKKSQPGKEIHPEDDPNYVGDIKDIDNLVKFINNDIGGKKLKKICKSPTEGSSGSGAPSANPASPAPTTPVSKVPKKPRDRSTVKTKQLTTTGVGESVELEDSLTPASETTKLLSSTTSSYLSIEQVSVVREIPAGGPDAQKAGTEMGNSSTSEKPDGDEDSLAKKDNSAVVKNHKVHDKTVQAVLPKPVVSDTKTDANKNDKNHILPSSGKSTPVARKEQAGDTKDGKGKNKNGGKDTGKGESTSNTDNNKKTKNKPPKIDTKSSSAGSEKSSPAEFKKETNVDNNREIPKGKEPQTSVSSPAVSSVSGLDLGDNEEFIFTDVDLPPSKEPEFIVVSKKKKRAPSQPATQGQSGGSSMQSSGQYHYSKDSQPFPSHNTSSFVPYSRGGQGQASSGHYQRSVKRSFTPPPSLKVSRPESFTKSPVAARDLSPSAFPSLTSGSSSDPRRRSMENLYDTGQLLQCDKDSDKESTKSLPADKGIGAGRACYPVSYATMVSTKTPRQSVDSSKAESVSSSMEEANLDDYPTPSSMKWKGSPQERRHSIGSAPEELSKTPTGSNLQRSGSQEVLPRDSDSAVKAVAGAKGLIQSDSAGSFVGSDADSARGSEAGSETPVEVFISPPASATTVVDEKKTSSVVDEKQSKPQAVPASKTSTIPTGSAPRATPPQTVSSTGSGSAGVSPSPVSGTGVRPKGAQPSSSSRSQAPTVKPEVVSKPVNNGHKNKKSVIFCNNKGQNVVPVDIFFGGDPVFSNEELESSVCQGNTPSSGKPLVSVPPPAKDKDCSVSNPSAQGAPSAPASSSSSSNDINPSIKPAKGPHIAGLNGLVSPRPPDSSSAVVLPQPPSTVPAPVSSIPAPTQGPQTVSQTLSPAVSLPGQAVKDAALASPAVVTNNVPQPNSSSLPSADAPSSDKPLKLPKGGISIAIGAGIKDAKPECKIFIQPESTAAPTSQARMDAINFLVKGWNKIEKQLKNGASSVQVYSAQA